jgi:MerR family Zn(II)-responsive transcriptional regulator of zntA
MVFLIPAKAGKQVMVEKTTPSSNFTIGRLSSLAEVDVATVRFYEHSGLLQAQERTNAGYRLYSRNSLARVQFIRRARETGYSLNQIRQILQLYDQGGSKAEVEQFTTTMLAEVDEKIRGLTKWRHLFGEISDYFERTNNEEIDRATVELMMRVHCGGSTH